MVGPMTDDETDAVITHPVLIIVVLIIAGITDAIVVPALLAAPGYLVLRYAPDPWNMLGLLLLVIPLGYAACYLFIRDTDDAWPFGPAERVLFRDPEESDG